MVLKFESNFKPTATVRAKISLFLEKRENIISLIARMTMRPTHVS